MKCLQSLNLNVKTFLSFENKGKSNEDRVILKPDSFSKIFRMKPRASFMHAIDSVTNITLLLTDLE